METNEALEKHMEATRTPDVVLAMVCGLVLGLAVYLLLGPGGTSTSGGISPTLTERDPWPVLGALSGLVLGALGARATYRYRRQQRRRRFWGL